MRKLQHTLCHAFILWLSLFLSLTIIFACTSSESPGIKDFIHKKELQAKLAEEQGRLIATEAQITALEVSLKKLSFDWWKTLPFTDARQAVNDEIAKCEQELQSLEQRKISTTEQITQLSRELDQCRDGGDIQIATIIRKALPLSLLLLAGSLLGMLFFKWFKYFILASIVQKLPPIDLISEQSHTTDISPEAKRLTCTIHPGEKFIIKHEQYTAGYTRTPELRKNTKYLYNISTPLMSLFCGFFLMSRYTNRGTDDYSIDISSDDPNEYFVEIELNPDCLYYVTPTALVAFTEGIQVSTRWHLLSLPAWCMGQLRFYILRGPGRIVLKGLGGISPGELKENDARTIKSHTLLFSTAGIKQHVSRTETFWPYLLNNSSLFDVRICGGGQYCMRNTNRAEAPIPNRVLNAAFSAFGKVFGF